MVMATIHVLILLLLIRILLLMMIMMMKPTIKITDRKTGTIYLVACG